MIRIYCTAIPLLIVLTVLGGAAPAAGPESPKGAEPPKEAAAATAMSDKAKDVAQQSGVSPEDMQKMMQAIMPGPMHERLARLAGEWTTASTLTVAGMPPEETVGSAKIMMVLDGRFVHEDMQETMMGQPVRASHLWGYNNGSKKFESVWAYTMSTGLMTMTGETKDDGRTIQWTAQFDNESGIRETLTVTHTFVSENEFSVELVGGKMPDGSDGPRMKTTYKRAAAASQPAR